MRDHLLIAYLSDGNTGILFRKFSLLSMYSRLFPTFSSIRFNVSAFMLRTLIYLDLSIVKVGKYCSICNILNADIQLEKHNLLNILSSSIAYFLLLCQKLGVHR